MRKFAFSNLPFTIVLAALLVLPFPAVAGSVTFSEESPTVSLREVASGLTSPVVLVEAPDQTGRLFIVDQIGLVRIWTPEAGLLPEPFLDLRHRIVSLQPGYDERGLLGFAFHPEYAANGRFFVFYNAPPRVGAPEGYDNTATISEFRVSADPFVANEKSEVVVLQIDKPQGNHNGGALMFGPDGYFYIAVGDGGGERDTGFGHVEDWYTGNAGGNGQDLANNLLGSILRIDMDGGAPYSVPSDNPFVGVDGLDEVWAYGFRNPSQLQFDDWTLFVADGGHGAWHEISIAVEGGNFGWNVKEGSHCFDAEAPGLVPEDCPGQTPEDDPLIDPILEYPTFANQQQPGRGAAVIGGNMYRSDDIPLLTGQYLYADMSRLADFPSGALYVAKPQTLPGAWDVQSVTIENPIGGRPGYYFRGLGQDSRGRFYVLGSLNLGPTGTTGKIFRIAPPQGR